MPGRELEFVKVLNRTATEHLPRPFRRNGLVEADPTAGRVIIPRATSSAKVLVAFVVLRAGISQVRHRHPGQQNQNAAPLGAEVVA